MDAINALMLIEAVLIVSAILVYKAIRFISPSLHGFHRVSVDSSNNDVVSTPMASSSSSFDIIDHSPSTKYDVFLSFRGEDTRDNFTSHLYKELCRAKIQTFIDNRLEKGEKISPILLRTIEESEIYVIIFSKDYASSTWCLDELVKILECKEKYGRIVIPVFYNADPSNIRKQSGSFKNSFIKHEQRFKNNMDKVQRWKDALTQAANLSGWDSINTRPESKFVEEIVEDVLRKLGRNSSYSSEGLVGIGHHILQMEELLALESPKVRIVGIWGKGGVGKTTLADVLFHKLKAKFESFSFVRNVRERLRRIGLDQLLKKCLSELLDGEDISIYNIRSSYVKNRLQCKKILIVLDDVDNYIQAEDLIKLCDWFGQGSRIIITSRDKQVLKNATAYGTYRVKEMNSNEALELFSLKAFKQKEPPKTYGELSELVVEHCQGLPLALVVSGCFLYGRRKEEWESALEKLKQTPDQEIFNVLKISFDGLDDNQKAIFLDLACFFRGYLAYLHKGGYGRDCLQDYYDFSIDIEICVLIERSLISIEDGVIMMHDLLRAMGREIAHQQVISEPRKPIRLCNPEDIYDVFRMNEGTETIHGIWLDICSIKKIRLKANAFQKMHKMRFLQFHKSSGSGHSNLLLPEGLDIFPEELRYLYWEDYPLPNIPLHFCAENLVHLEMPNNQIQKLWDGDQHFPGLKIFNLSCERLIELPDLSHMPNIEYIHLHKSKNLVEVYSSNILSKLRDVYIYGCNGRLSLHFGNGNNNGISLGCTTVYNFFDLRTFSLIKMTIKVFTFDSGEFSFYKLNVKHVSITKILRAIDTSERAELKLLGLCLDSLLPFVRKICWSDISFELGNFGIDFVYYPYRSDNTIWIQCPMNLREPKIIDPGQSLMQSCMKGSTTKEVALSLEQQMDHQNLKEVESRGCNRLTRIPKSINRWSLLKDLTLQESDNVSSTSSVPGLATLKSIMECDSTWLQSKTDHTFSMNTRKTDPKLDMGSTVGGIECGFLLYRLGFIYFLKSDLCKDYNRNLFEQAII